MIYPDEFEALVKRVAELNGLDHETADLVVGVVGDCLALDESGKVIANMPDGRTLLINWPEKPDED